MRTIVEVAAELDAERRRTATLEAILADCHIRIAELSDELADAREAAGYTRPPSARTVALRETISVLADMLNGRIPPDERNAA